MDACESLISAHNICNAYGSAMDYALAVLSFLVLIAILTALVLGYYFGALDFFEFLHRKLTKKPGDKERSKLS